MPETTNQKTPGNAPPSGVKVLKVNEAARLLDVTGAHIINLIESGELAAVDVAGHGKCAIVPLAALEQLAAKLKVTPAQLLEFIRHFPGRPPSRAMYRIPVEAFQAFINRRHSLTP